MVRILAVLGLVGFWQADLYAAGSTSEPPPEEQVQAEAVKHYNKGLNHRDKAWDYEKAAAEAKHSENRKKHEQAAQKEYRKAIKAFTRATEVNPRFHEAFGSLGYAYRKTGDYQAALEAYDRALALKPDYTEAIEYRGEAYLGLDRIEEAKAAYNRLVKLNPEHAAKLLEATKKWVWERQGTPAAGVSKEVLVQTAEWIQEKEAAAGGAGKKGAKW